MHTRKATYKDKLVPPETNNMLGIPCFFTPPMILVVFLISWKEEEPGKEFDEDNYMSSMNLRVTFLGSFIISIW